MFNPFKAIRQLQRENTELRSQVEDLEYFIGELGHDVAALLHATGITPVREFDEITMGSKPPPTPPKTETIH